MYDILTWPTRDLGTAAVGTHGSGCGEQATILILVLILIHAFTGASDYGHFSHLVGVQAMANAILDLSMTLDLAHQKSHLWVTVKASTNI